MSNLLRLAIIALLSGTGGTEAQDTKATAFQPVPELGYQVMPDFFRRI